MKHFIIFILVLKLCSSLDTELNNKCNFIMDQRIFTCEGLDNYSADIASFLTNKTTVVFLKNIREIIIGEHFHIPDNFKTLKRFDILDSGSITIEQRGFIGLNHVEHMKISNNTWHTIKNNTFQGLNKLEVLVLVHNKIKMLHENCFDGLPKVKSLDLSGNELSRLTPNVFQNLPKLESLYMSHNFIKTVDNNIFNGLHSLTMLMFTNNSIDNVNVEEINKLENLEYLYLDFNKITTLEGQLTTEKLKFFQVNNNQLRRIDEGLLKKCGNLMNLDLSNNQLSSLNDHPFVGLKGLKLLNLHGNSINVSSFNKLKSDILVVV